MPRLLNHKKMYNFNNTGYNTGKHLKLAAHGFQMGIFNPKKDLLGHDPSGP